MNIFLHKAKKQNKKNINKKNCKQNWMKWIYNMFYNSQTLEKSSSKVFKKK